MNRRFTPLPGCRLAQKGPIDSVTAFELVIAARLAAASNSARLRTADARNEPACDLAPSDDLLLRLRATFVALALGFSDQWADLVPLPLALDGIGMTGCTLLHSAEWTGLPTTAGASGVDAFALAIPAQNALLSLPVHLQAYALAPGANPMQVIASNGLHWILGNQ